MKDLAQVAYETMSSTHGIPGGPAPWASLPSYAKLRWKLVAERVIAAAQENAIASERTVLAVAVPTPVKPIDAPDTRKEQALAAEVLAPQDPQHPIIDGLPDSRSCRPRVLALEDTVKP